MTRLFIEKKIRDVHEGAVEVTKGNEKKIVAREADTQKQKMILVLSLSPQTFRFHDFRLTFRS